MGETTCGQSWSTFLEHSVAYCTLKKMQYSNANTVTSL